MFNKNLFKARVIEKGLTLGDVAKEINIDTATLYRKMNGTSDFSRAEIQKICSFLSLDNPLPIFFA